MSILSRFWVVILILSLIEEEELILFVVKSIFEVLIGLIFWIVDGIVVSIWVDCIIFDDLIIDISVDRIGCEGIVVFIFGIVVVIIIEVEGVLILVVSILFKFWVVILIFSLIEEGGLILFVVKSIFEVLIVSIFWIVDGIVVSIWIDGILVDWIIIITLKKNFFYISKKKLILDLEMILLLMIFQDIYGNCVVGISIIVVFNISWHFSLFLYLLSLHE